MHRSLAIVLLASACAAGSVAGQDQKQDAAVEHHDASYLAPDAPVHVDARLPDAFVPNDAPAPDAASALFCNDNSECTNAGECCVILVQPPGICGPGQIILGACIPS